MVEKPGIENSQGLILIVDDIPKNLQVLGQTLCGEDYEVAAVSSGEQVVSSARKYQPDLILLDIMMPGKDGFEVCRELKQDEELNAIPVIFLTAKVDQQSINKGLKLGGADYITKPFNTQELLARVQTHVELKRSRDQIKAKNEELEKLNETKDNIYSIIGHDLRSSINAILGFSDLLLRESDDYNQEQTKYLTVINRASREIGNLLSDLLNWARLQTGDFTIQKSTFSIENLIRKTIRLLQSSAAPKALDIEFSSTSETYLRGDIRLIGTIVRNFISNAIKFSYEGGHIEVILEQDGEIFQISVIDEGKGMTEETQQRLFNSESHPNERGTKNEKGSGFGLMLCQQLAMKHGGNIDFESAPEEGSRFTLSIPIEEPEMVEA